MMFFIGILLTVVSSLLTLSHLLRLHDKGYWPGAWWKIPASVVCVAAGVWLTAFY